MKCLIGVENCLNAYYSTQQTLIFRKFKRLYAFESEYLHASRSALVRVRQDAAPATTKASWVTADIVQPDGAVVLVRADSSTMEGPT
ncbi:hypothetical protein AV530_003965 [Patagioenas fasciata monilis]|uniref:Uncharacterized protein n=1 Tax=Patagioenas fasciata monilis TaxID=372326 RepID=A0A1V4JUY4_PATFA|nr:hypothetical protein AV530_003965 [Patagioenas fasciata monilis]